MKNQPLLLIIDDETTILKTLREALEDEDYRVETLDNGNKSLDLIGQLIPDLVLLDIFMPNCDGIKLLQQIKKEYPQQKVIMISGFGNIPIAIEAVKNGAYDFIEKPLNLDEILSKISFLKNNLNENANYKQNKNEDFESFGIIGKSYLFLELMYQINQVSNLNFPLLIYGQHGTGKTLLSKFIHLKKYLNLDNFYKINCLALNQKEILNKIEKIFIQKNATLFIKNIENLDADIQKKLLFEFKNNQQDNLRLITTSSTSLFNLVKKNKFNEELFHKLNITPIEIPALNKRRYDIPLLTNYFITIANQKYKKNIIFANPAIRILRNHNWTGNITELKATIEKIVQSISLNEHIISAEILSNFFNEKHSPIIEEQSFLRFKSLKEATHAFEKKFLIHLLKKNQYDLNQLSNRLDLTTSQLRDKMLKFNIEIRS